MRCLGIDQSYTRTGIAIVEGESIHTGKILSSASYPFKGMKSKTEKRRFITKLILHAVEKYKPDIIITERIRTFSQGFLSTSYIKATGALIGTIVDAAYPNKVYSVDTRSWKARVCGGSSGMHKADKGVSVRFIARRYKLQLNDDEADAICIALYGLDKENKKMLKLES